MESSSIGRGDASVRHSCVDCAPFMRRFCAVHASILRGSCVDSATGGACPATARGVGPKRRRALRGRRRGEECYFGAIGTACGEPRPAVNEERLHAIARARHRVRGPDRSFHCDAGGVGPPEHMTCSVSNGASTALSRLNATSSMLSRRLWQCVQQSAASGPCSQPRIPTPQGRSIRAC